MEIYKTKHYEHWIDSRIKKKKSKIHGEGIFTSRFISAGEVIMIWGGEIFSMEEVKEGKAKLESLSGFKEGLFLGQPVQERDTLDQFLNHSCDPNLWMKDEVTIITMRDLQAGEELTIDYALFELDDKWVMPINCKCGTSICRKTITGQDWHLPTLHQKYLGHFIPYLNNQIKKLKEDQVSKNFLLNDF